MIIEEQDNKSVKLFEKVISFINHLSEIDKNQEKNLIESILNIKEDKEWRDKELNKITDNDIKGISLSEFHVIECIGKK